MANSVRTIILLIVVAFLVTGCIFAQPSSPTDAPASSPPGSTSWQEEFGISDCTLVPTGRNEFFILEPGFQLVLEGGSLLSMETLAITVLEETREVDGVLTRVVEEREWRDDELIEVSRNFFAMCETTKDIFYFGEEVDMYQGGQLASHSGAWLAGENGAKAGLMMPGEPKLGMRYYQEIAPRVAMDRAEIVSLDDVLETPAGTFSSCLKTKEGTALNPLEQEFKIYAAEIGLIQDANLLLIQYGFVSSDTVSGTGSE